VDRFAVRSAPRALLAELGLARILLGSSGGGQFLVVLPGEARQAAEDFLQAAAGQVAELSSGLVKLIWAVTDNLGDWAVIRRRLNDELRRKRTAPLADGSGNPGRVFQPFTRAFNPEATPTSRANWAPRCGKRRASPGRPRRPER